MLFDKLHDEEGRLAALGRYSVLDSENDVVFDRITALVKAVLDVPICAVTLIARDRQWFKAIEGLDARGTPRTAAFCHYTIQQRDVMLVADAHIDPRFARNPLVVGPPHIRSYAGTPLTTPDGFNLGALCVIDQKSRTYSHEQIALLRQFADIVVRQLDTRSATLPDPLTGSMTREGMVEAMRAQVAAAQETGRPNSLLLFAIDHFRHINEEQGRAMGDEVLRGVADCFRHSIRRADVLARFGGNTMAILLSGLGAYDAVACAERLRRRVAQTTFLTTPSRQVTVSCGVATLRRGDSVDLWLAGAEAALFAAKTRGHNQCISVDSLR